MAAPVHKEYNDTMPSQVSGLQSFPIWVSKLPITDFSSGAAELFNDGRISWMLEKCGPIKGFDVLELGPLESGHTYMIHKNNPANIDAIEANANFYLKCLCIKEAFGLDRANYFLGNFCKWLAFTEKKYDLIVASGVLYHMADPVGLLDLISKRTNRIFIWTHFAPTEAYEDGHPLKAAYVGKERLKYKDIEVNIHKRTYLDATQNPTFCGGVQDEHTWLEREGILSILKLNGFDKIEELNHQGHPNGPCFSVYASK